MFDVVRCIELLYVMILLVVVIMMMIGEGQRNSLVRKEIWNVGAENEDKIGTNPMEMCSIKYHYMV